MSDQATEQLLIVEQATHPYDKIGGCAPCTNFEVNQPTFKRKHSVLYDTNTTNDDSVRLAGLPGGEINITFVSKLSATDLTGANTQILAFLPAEYEQVDSTLECNLFINTTQDTSVTCNNFDNYLIIESLSKNWTAGDTIIINVQS